MVGPHRNTYICPQETWYWDSGNITEVVMSGVRCTGTELSLDQCAHHGTHIACKRTGTRFTAGVICSESKWRASQEKEVLGHPFQRKRGLLSGVLPPCGKPASHTSWGGGPSKSIPICPHPSAVTSDTPLLPGCSCIRSAAALSTGAGDCLHRGPAPTHAVLCCRRELPVPLSPLSQLALWPPPSTPILLPDSQPGTS